MLTGLTGRIAALMAFAAMAVSRPAQAQSGDQTAHAIYLVIILIVLLSSLVAGWRFRSWASLRYALIWVLLGLMCIAVYAFRPEMTYLYNRIYGAIVPSAPMSAANGAITVRMGMDGHFHVRAQINGQPAEMLVDTGASLVVLPRRLAEDLGVNVGALSFTTPFQTANGVAMGAVFRIDAIDIGGIRRNNVPAAIVPNLSKPLLGMSFFNTLSSFAVSGETLTLRD